MKPVRLKGSVSMPTAPTRGKEILAWAKQAQRTLKQLDDKVVVVPPARGGGGTATCPLSRVTADSDDDTLAWINEGAIHAAGEHADVGGEGTTFTITANYNIWAQVEITAEVLENTLTGNWTAANLMLGSGAPPTDHVWTPDAEVGIAYAPLGYWDADKKWHAYGCGSVTFLFCAQSTQQGYARFFRG